MKVKASIVIDVSDVRFILGQDFFRYWYWTIHNAECKHCNAGHTSVMVDYTIELDALNDFKLMGKCQLCRQPIKRFLINEQTRDLVKRADAVRLLHKITV